MHLQADACSQCQDIPPDHRVPLLTILCDPLLYGDPDRRILGMDLKSLPLQRQRRHLRLDFPQGLDADIAEGTNVVAKDDNLHSMGPFLQPSVWLAMLRPISGRPDSSDDSNQS